MFFFVCAIYDTEILKMTFMILSKILYMLFNLSRCAEKEYVSRLAQSFAVQKLGAPKCQKVRIFQRLF